MILTPLLTVVLASLAQLTVAQLDDQGPIVFDAEHNATSIVGTWSSGSQAVSTGPVSRAAQPAAHKTHGFLVARISVIQQS